jgi:hypothetical protein
MDECSENLENDCDGRQIMEGTFTRPGKRKKENWHATTLRR